MSDSTKTAPVAKTAAPKAPAPKAPTAPTKAPAPKAPAPKAVAPAKAPAPKAPAKPAPKPVAKAPAKPVAPAPKKAPAKAPAPAPKGKAPAPKKAPVAKSTEKLTRIALTKTEVKEFIGKTKDEKEAYRKLHELEDKKGTFRGATQRGLQSEEKTAALAERREAYKAYAKNPTRKNLDEVNRCEKLVLAARKALLVKTFGK